MLRFAVGGERRSATVLEGRLAPEDDTERRAVQVLTAGGKGDR